jgi:hypothetical protein
VQAPHAPGGRFSKADFAVDLPARTVTCPAGRLPGHPPEGRAQDRPPHAPETRRPEGPRPGRLKAGADFALLAASVNLARLAVLGLVRSGATWEVRPT